MFDNNLCILRKKKYVPVYIPIPAVLFQPKLSNKTRFFLFLKIVVAPLQY